MRVLHVINDLRLAGAERFLADLCTVQAASGMDVSVAPLTFCGSALETKIRDAGASLLLPSRARAIRSPAHVFRLRELFPKFDLVHIQLFPAQLWGAVAVRTMGNAAPVLVTTEQNTHNSRRNIAAFRPVDRAMYNPYRAIAAITDATRDALATYLPDTAPKIAVIHNGISLSRFRADGSPDERAVLFPQVPPEAFLILSVGRLEAQKDFPTLIRAVAQVEGAHLVVIGEGRLRASLEALAQSLGAASRVHLAGLSNDVPALVRNADAYAQSSAWEGFGIAAVEAMASGIPLVITSVPGLREVVGDAGIAVPPANPEAFADALRELATNAAKRGDLAKRGRERAANFTIEKSADAYTTLYRDALQGC